MLLISMSGIFFVKLSEIAFGFLYFFCDKHLFFAQHRCVTHLYVIPLISFYYILFRELHETTVVFKTTVVFDRALWRSKKKM